MPVNPRGIESTQENLQKNYVNIFIFVGILLLVIVADLEASARVLYLKVITPVKGNVDEVLEVLLREIEWMKVDIKVSKELTNKKKKMKEELVQLIIIQSRK